MKKMKLLAPLMASVAVAAPVMVSLTSCGRINYTEKISEFKDKTISNFMDLTRNTHRGVWAEGEIFNYIVKQMTDFGFENYSGRDFWSQTQQASEKIAEEKAKWQGHIKDTQLQSIFSEYGNIWYDIPATKGYEKSPKIIVHAHMDVSMAWASDADKYAWANAKKDIADVQYNREDDYLYIDGKKVSLGADDGIGIAAMLAMAELQNKFTHGPIRLLFTAGESEGTAYYASGADYLQNDQRFDGKQWKDKERTGVEGNSFLAPNSTPPFGEKDEFPYIISTSGIYKNSVYSSCGGIHECQFLDNALDLSSAANKIDWTTEIGGQKYKLYKLSLSGLHGGQSARYINDNYVNALQLIMAMVFSSDTNLRFLDGESKQGQYAIQSSANLTFASLLDKETLKKKFEMMIDITKNECPNETWEKFEWSFDQITNPSTEGYGEGWSFTPTQTRRFNKLFAWELYYGPSEWFDKEHKTVKTSCNFGNMSFKVNQTAPANSSISVYNVCRSASAESLEYFYQISHGMMEDAFEAFYTDISGGKTAREQAQEHTLHNSKPVWTKNDEDKMVKGLTDGFKNMGITPTIWDNHGWIEISCFTETYQALGWDAPYMSCIGPEIRDSHNVGEEAWTDSLNQVFGALLYVFEHVQNF